MGAGFRRGLRPDHHLRRLAPTRPAGPVGGDVARSAVIENPLNRELLEIRERSCCARSFGRGELRNMNRKGNLLTPALHKCVEEREIERRALVLGINERHYSANPLPQEKECIGGVLGKSNKIKPNQTMEV